MCSADPPRKRIDVVPLSHANGTPRLSLGNLAEGSPLAPRRALTVQQMYVYLTRRTHTTVLLLFWNMSETTRVSRYQKGKTRKVKTNLDLLEQEIVSGSGICWAICKSAPHPKQPRQHPTTQFFTGRMPFLPPNQQRQSTEGTASQCFLMAVAALCKRVLYKMTLLTAY